VGMGGNFQKSFWGERKLGLSGKENFDGGNLGYWRIIVTHPWVRKEFRTREDRGRDWLETENNGRGEKVQPSE